MSPLLIAHICAGSVAILSGAAALSVRKGERLHRAFGKAFFVSMLIMSALGAYLATFLPQTASVAANMAVAVLTAYLVATGWATVRRQQRNVGLFEYGAFLVAASVTITLLIFGVRTPNSQTGRFDATSSAPYFVFAAFAAFAAVGDLRMILRGGISGRRRIMRHLWRMCFALFFATAFFFVGQQKVMPAFVRGSPFLLLPPLAPLALMVFWLVRTRSKNRSAQRD